MADEEVPGNQPEDLGSATDENPGFERKPRSDLGPEPRLTHGFPDHEKAGCPDVHRIEVPELVREPAGPERSMAADVHPSQERNQCGHEDAGVRRAEWSARRRL
jgi:hypothetical protein